MLRTLTLVAAFSLVPSLITAVARGEDDRTVPAGLWKAKLITPGGDLPFWIEITEKRGPAPVSCERKAFIINGDERIEVPQFSVDQWSTRLVFDHYDSSIKASYSVSDPMNYLAGQWTKRRSGTETVEMRFEAEKPDGAVRVNPGWGHHDRGPTAPFAGRWKMIFASESDPAIGEFRVAEFSELRGTIETTTGDYRYLAGSASGNDLTLSTFDGAHAFLFKASLQPDGSLKGDFWSGPTFHDTFTAVRDDNAKLPDAFTLTKAAQPDASASLAALSFPDLEGKPRSLADPAFAGKARIIELFGTWCPNCRDATHLLTQLDGEYRAKGLSVLALAFEVTGDAERDRRQARLYADRHDIKYPILIAGVNKKDLASAAFPIIDKLRAYPTFVFLDRKSHIRAVYTGFSGPATGQEHDKLKRQFRALIEELLKGE